MNEKLYKDILDRAEIAFAYHKVIFDNKIAIDYIFLDANAAFEKITGLKVNEIIGKKVTEVIPNIKKDSFDWIKEYGRIVQQNEKIDFIQFASALNKHYRVYALPLEDDCFVTLFTDISDIEHQLLLAEDAQKVILDNISENLWIANLDLTISYMSADALQLFGYEEKDLGRISIKELVSEENFLHLQNVFNKELILRSANKDLPSAVLELEHTTKDGNTIVFEHSFRYLYDLDGKPYKIIGFSRNLTKQKEESKLLKESKDKLRLILDSTTEGIYGIDTLGKCTFCNTSCLKLLGIKQESDMLGKNTHHLMHHHSEKGEHIPLSECKIMQVMRKKKALHIKKDIFWRTDGTPFYVEYFAHPQIENDEIIGAVVTFYDITERIKTEEDLVESERSKSILLKNLPGMAYRCQYDRKWTMEFVSEGSFDLIGYYPENLVDNKDISFNEVITPQWREFLRKKWIEAIEKREIFKEEYEVIAANNQIKWVLEQGQAIYDESGNVEALEGLIIDITEQKMNQFEVEYLSYHDALTGLFNRFYYEKEIKKVDLTNHLPLSIIIADINGLKLVNDALGHQKGDQLLINAANIIRNNCRMTDIVARTGGDEFTILMPNTNEETAQNVFKAISLECKVFNNKQASEALFVNISMGYATKIKESQNFQEIQKLAEDYMYRRKLLERNSSQSAIIASIQSTMFARSEETESHAERLRLYTKQIGKKLNLSQNHINELALLSTLHDIGKVGIDDSILKKPGKLTKEEWVEMKKHPEIGYRIAMSSPNLVPVAEYILTHHERWDGEGYPQGLKAYDIPLLARILSIVDAFDAMTQDRLYRKAISIEEAVQEIKDNAGTQFDPYLTTIFFEVLADEKKGKT